MKRILIIKPSSLGDIVHTLPVATALSRQVPGLILDWVVRPEYAELVRAHPAVRRIHLFHRRTWGRPSRIGKTLPEIAALVKSIRGERYDAVLDFQGLFRSGLISYLSGAKKRIGFANAREGAVFFYNRKIRVPTDRIHAVDRYLLFLKELGFSDSGVDYGLKIPGETEKAVEYLLETEGVRPNDPLVVLNPNARWETKRWSLERFVALANRLVEKLDVYCVFIGGPGDEGAIQRLVPSGEERIHSLAGRTSLPELASLLQRACLMITCDSGPMHLAVAMGTEVVALFGPTDPLRTGPCGPGHHVLRHDLACAPCLRRTCPKENLFCMESITEEELFRVVRDILSASRHRTMET